MDQRSLSSVWKPSLVATEITPNCPRCGSSNTKFCYYNNYSLTQPRYFCKGCRRYWTKGGSLRNVPIGGGCRKNNRRSSSSLGFVGRSSSSKNALASHGIASAATINSSDTNTNNNNNGVGCSNSHIDLALVYANFLSQKPDLCKPTSANNNDNMVNGPNELIIPEFDPGLEFSSSTFHDDNNGQVLLCGFDSFQERFSQETMLWSNNNISSSNNNPHNLMVTQNQTMQVSSRELLGLPIMMRPLEEEEEEEADRLQEENMLNGNWSPFDLPSDEL